MPSEEGMRAMTEILPVILSGGAGTRLWPASRSQYPKQLLSLGGERTLLQATALRMDGMPGAGRACTVVCNEAHRYLVAEQLLAGRAWHHFLSFVWRMNLAYLTGYARYGIARFYRCEWGKDMIFGPARIY
jgi:hypothetical protein